MNDFFGVGLWRPVIGGIILALVVGLVRWLRPSTARERSIKQIDAQRRTVRIVSRVLRHRRGEVHQLALPAELQECIPAADANLRPAEINDSRKRYNEELKKHRRVSFSDKQTIQTVFWLARKQAKARRTLENMRYRHVSRFARDDNDRSLSVTAVVAVSLWFVMYLVPFLAFLGSGSWWQKFDFSLRGMRSGVWPPWYSALFFLVLCFAMLAAVAAGAIAAGVFARDRVSMRRGRLFQVVVVVVAVVVGGGLGATVGGVASLAMFLESVSFLSR